MIAGNLHLISSLYLLRANLCPFVLFPTGLHSLSRSFSSPARTPRYIYRAIVSMPPFVLPGHASQALSATSCKSGSSFPPTSQQVLFSTCSIRTHFSCLRETRTEHSFPDDYLLTALIVPCRHGNALLQSQHCVSLSHTTAESCSKKS